MALALRPDQDAPGLPAAVDAATIGAALGLHKRNANLRASDENWPFDLQRCRGGRRRLYRVDALPEDVQLALVRHLVSQPGGGASGAAPSREVEKPEAAPVEDIAQASSRERAQAVQRVAAVDAYEAWAEAHGETYGTLREAQDAFVEAWRAKHPEQKVSRASLLRWRAAYRKHGICGLVSRYSRRGNPTDWPEAAKRFLKALWLVEEQPSFAWAIERCRFQAEREEWALPSARTMRRFLESTPYAEQVLLREGVKAFVQKVLPHLERDWTGVAPLEIWSGDHCTLNTFCELPDGRRIRPTMTTWLDCGTRDVVGWAIVETASSDTILGTFVQGAREFGVPAVAYTDNGRDYSSEALAGGFDGRFRLTAYQRSKTNEEIDGLYRLLDVQALFAIPGNARAKPVERFFGTMERDLLKALPGYVGRSPAHRPANAHKEIQAGNVLTFAELEAYVGAWIERYRARKHSGQGMRNRSPIGVWNDWLASGGVPRKAAPATLALLLAEGRRVKVTRKGVRLAGRSYWSAELFEVADHGERVVLRYDPEAPELVWVFGRDGRFLCEVPLINNTHPLDQDAPAELGKRQKAVKEQHREAVAEVRADQRAITTELKALGVRTTGEERARPDVVRAVRTAVDADAREVVERAEESRVERAERRKLQAKAARQMRTAVATLPPPEKRKSLQDEALEEMRRALSRQA